MRWAGGQDIYLNTPVTLFVRDRWPEINIQPGTARITASRRGIWGSACEGAVVVEHVSAWIEISPSYKSYQLTLDQESIKETYQNLSRTGNGSHLGTTWTSHNAVIFPMVSCMVLPWQHLNYIFFSCEAEGQYGLILTVLYSPYVRSQRFYWLLSFMVLVVAANSLYITCMPMTSETVPKATHSPHMPRVDVSNFDLGAVFEIKATYGAVRCLSKVAQMHLRIDSIARSLKCWRYLINFWQ